MDNGPVAVVDIDTDNDRRGRVDRGAKPGALRQKAPLYLFFCGVDCRVLQDLCRYLSFKVRYYIKYMSRGVVAYQLSQW